MNTKPPTRMLVESDIRSLVDHVVAQRSESPYVVTATITQAQGYGCLSPMYYAPWVGMLATLVPIEIELIVKVLLELERDGTVLNTFLIDERTTINRSITSPDAYHEAYQSLVADYRRKVLPRIESEFLLTIPDQLRRESLGESADPGRSKSHAD